MYIAFVKNGRKALLLCGGFLALSPAIPSAQASIIVFGSPYTFSGTNAPDTFTAVTTFSSTPTLVDGGALSIWETQVATGTTGEWDIFNMATTNGGPLANNINGYWGITIDYVLSQAVYFDQTALQWTVNGVPVGPLTNGIGSICCATSSNPILPGWAYYASGFQDPLAAGTQTDWNEIFVTPYSFVEAGGINPDTANGFTFALHFTLQSPETPSRHRPRCLAPDC